MLPCPEVGDYFMLNLYNNMIPLLNSQIFGFSSKFLLSGCLHVFTKKKKKKKNEK